VAAGASRLVASMLFAVTAGDVRTIVGAVLLMFASAAVASLIPARRATRLDPIVALRYE
jgi:ABC-type lipoprotein release transport system permease subunit